MTSSYLHLTDLIIYDKILASGFFVTKVAISYLATDDKGVSYPVSRIKEDNKQVLLKHMINKNKDLYEFSLTTPPAAYTREYEFPELKDRIREGQGYDDVEIRNRLKDYQAGMSFQDIDETYGFDQQELKVFVARANPLFTALTSKNLAGGEGLKNYRAQCEDYAQDLPIERWVVPKLARGLECKREAAGAMKKLLAIAQEKKQADVISRWTRMVFDASNYKFSYLQIQSPDDLKFITSSYNKIFDQRRWYLEVRLKDISEDNPKRKAWKKAMPKQGQIEFIEKVNEDMGHGSAQLFYQRKDHKIWLKERNKGIAKKDNWSQIGSDQLKYISQMLLIVLGG